MPDRKTAILDAAIAVIAERGVRGLRVEEVAKAAGVAVSLLYYHFGSREGLVRATLDHANERAAAAPAPSGDETGYDAARRILLAEMDAAPHVRETSVVWGEVLASAVFEPGLRDQLSDANAIWVGIVAAAIRAGQDDGSVRASLDANAAAELLTALIDGLSSRWHAGLADRDRAVALLDAAIATELRA